MRAPRDLWFRELATATCAWLRGEFDLASEHIAVLSHLGEHYGLSDTAAVVGAVTFTNAYHHGGLSGLRPSLELFAATYAYVPAWTLGSGVAAVSDGDWVAAREALERGVSLLSDSAADGLWLTVVCLAVEIAVRLDADRQAVERLLQILEPHSGQYVVVGTLTTEFGPVDRCLGLLEFTRGRYDAAARYFASGSPCASACGPVRGRP